MNYDGSAFKDSVLNNQILIIFFTNQLNFNVPKLLFLIMDSIVFLCYTYAHLLKEVSYLVRISQSF